MEKQSSTRSQGRLEVTERQRNKDACSEGPHCVFGAWGGVTHRAEPRVSLLLSLSLKQSISFIRVLLQTEEGCRYVYYRYSNECNKSKYYSQIFMSVCPLAPLGICFKCCCFFLMHIKVGFSFNA